MQNANHNSRPVIVQNKALLIAAQAVAAAAWNNRIERPVPAFRGWEVASDLLRKAYLNG